MIRKAVFATLAVVLVAIFGLPLLETLVNADALAFGGTRIIGLGFSSERGLVVKMYNPAYGKDSLGRYHEAATEFYSFGYPLFIHIEHCVPELLSVKQGRNTYFGSVWGSEMHHFASTFKPIYRSRWEWVARFFQRELIYSSRWGGSDYKTVHNLQLLKKAQATLQTYRGLYNR